MGRGNELMARFLRHARVFSPYYAVLELCAVVDRPISLRLHKPFSHHILSLKERYIMKWARRFFAKQIQQYRNRPPVNANHKDVGVIWLCWLQGIDQAPSFVKGMIERIGQHANGHEIRLVTLENYKKYCDLPQHFIERYENGEMPQQQFADVLRAGLLAQQGGLWIDVSMLVVHDIPEEVFTLPIYNVKEVKPNAIRDAVACDCTEWQAYFLGSQRESVTYSFIYECFLYYWEHYDTLIDYFLFSYLAKIAREDLIGGMQEYASVPANNACCEQLSDYLMQGLPFDSTVLRRIEEGSTFVYKLTWKGEYPKIAKDGTPTLASVLLP